MSSDSKSDKNWGSNYDYDAESVRYKLTLKREESELSYLSNKSKFSMKKMSIQDFEKEL